MELIDVYCFYIYIINAFQPASLAGWDPCWWEGLWMKQRFYLTSPAWRPDGRLECSQGDGADLFICPSCILLEYHLPSHPLFKGWEQLLLSCTLRLALSLPYLLSLSPLHPPLLPPSTHCHTFSLTVRLSVSLTQLIFLMWTTKWGVGDFFPKWLMWQFCSMVKYDC